MEVFLKFVEESKHQSENTKHVLESIVTNFVTPASALALTSTKLRGLPMPL